jgi:hypothetical protein
VGLVIAETICLSAFIIELSRAVGGNSLSWAYVFEWPLLGGYGVFMWRQLVRESRGTELTVAPILPEASDDALSAYNDYLAQIHRGDASKPK